MIRFSFRLLGPGRAEATIKTADAEASLPAARGGEPLERFVQCVLRLFRVDWADCLWELDTGAIAWQLKRMGDRVEIQALWLDSTLKGDLIPDRVLFHAEDRLADFAEEVRRELGSLLDEWGETRYEQVWGRPFPLREYLQLQQTLRRLSRRREKRAGE